MLKNKTFSIVIAATALTVILGMVGLVTIPNVQSQESYPLASDNDSTISVTGDASMQVEPDQAIMIVVKQSQPGNFTSVLTDQKSKTDALVNEIKGVLGNDTNSSVAIGQMSLNPSFWGNPSYSDVSIFTVYSTTSVNTDIKDFSTIVKKLTESGYGFESVSAGPIVDQMMQAASLQAEEIPTSESLESSEIQDKNKVTINVTVNTKPGNLDDVLSEYDSKYAKLVDILGGAGINATEIKTTNVNVNPFYYGPNQGNIYQTYSQIIIKTGVDNIENLSNVVQKSGAYVENTFLTVSDEAIENIRDEVNKQALENARQRAEALAEIAGLEVKGIKNIEAKNSLTNPNGGYQSYKGLYIIPPYYYQSTSGEIASSITVEFELAK
jgi:uncharacterized protein YggE